MNHRTSLSLSLDAPQRRALLSHGVWTIDDLDPDSLDALSSLIYVPRFIKPLPSLPRRHDEVKEYFCGISSVDGLLSQLLGGVLTEICGLPGSGRTTLCLRYASLSPGTTLWIDTEGCLFPPKGVKLAVLRIHDHLQLFSLTHRIRKIVDKIDPSLIVVDSIASTMRGEAAVDSARTPLLWEFASEMKKIASERGIAVLITNHMAKVQFHGFVRTLGQSWQNIPTHCFEIKAMHERVRVLRVLKSPCLPRIEIEMMNEP